MLKFDFLRPSQPFTIEPDGFWALPFVRQVPAVRLGAESKQKGHAAVTPLARVEDVPTFPCLVCLGHWDSFYVIVMIKF